MIEFKKQNKSQFFKYLIPNIIYSKYNYVIIKIVVSIVITVEIYHKMLLVKITKYFKRYEKQNEQHTFSFK